MKEGNTINNCQVKQLKVLFGLLSSPLKVLHMVLNHLLTAVQESSESLKPNNYVKESNMSNTIFVPKLKHQQLLNLAIVEDRKQKKNEFEESLKLVEIYLKQYRWLDIAEAEMIFDSETGLLWQANILETTFPYYGKDEAYTVLKSLKIGKIEDWSLPSAVELFEIASSRSFPFREGQNIRIQNHQMWVTNVANETINLDQKTSPYISGWSGARFIGKSDVLLKNYINIDGVLKLNGLGFILECHKYNWSIKPWDYHASYTSEAEAEKAFADFKKSIEFIIYYKTQYEKSTAQFPLSQVWKDVDFISTRLPKIESLRFTDIDQGVWEFYTSKALQDSYQKIDSDFAIRARNPELDIRNAKVAIDFGTSSTAVAIRTNGRDELLRIGLQEKDFKKHVLSDNDFENPTILEFIDILELLQAWESEASRPLVDWTTVHCSHEARTRFRENDSDPKIVGSIFARLKQWALRDAEDARVRITDQQGHEYEFKPLQELNPTKGQPLNIQKSYPQLDPIELYAWFLGMNINWRERGIYLKYYMTFPVAYPNEVKEKILASFRRGLQRSLPESLIYAERFNEFSVQELESEPAAFAASALNALKIEPTKEGTAYAVFDFGGGTTDFDYGIYRLPNDDESDEGWDDVIEHFGSSGDKFLGGENLLENLAYLVFKHNQNYCRDKEISFTKPIDAQSFAGSERLIAKTQAAYTNTTLLMSRLRPLWEQGAISQNSDGVQKMALINRHGQRVDCEIQIPQTKLIEWLQERIREGLKNFFTALKVSFEQQHDVLPQVVHILLAGNASRSRIVLGLLGRLENDDSKILHELLLTDMADIFLEESPTFEIHLPLQTDADNPYAPTTKTGVALGLLRVSPGETLKVINHAQVNNTDSPFQYFVGTHRRNIFSATLKRGDIYEEWQEIGAIRGGIFPLLYTTQPQALNGIERGTNGLIEQSIEFSGSDVQGKKVFAKITNPDTIELGLAINIENIDQLSHRRIVQLKI